MYGAANKDLGSMASHAVWKAAFLHAVPDGMESAHAAPLMCGGATVFTALHDYPVRPTDRVGVVGVGGLGHLAIQFAARMGCEVVVFSGTESKKDEALRLGAREFYATKDLKDYRDVCKTPVNALLVTTSAQPDWNGYFPILAPEAIVFPLGLSQGDLKVPYLPFLLKGIRVQGSVVANRQTHREMLRFAAVHKIKPIIQEFPLTVDGLNKAFDTLGNGKMKYRAVLVAQ